ncbi:hypothetical protein HGRIS_010323 [Hohenbuehelia grisea]|uniref:Uncharacterized protein n=1 Tax=Hohenbuehelia grisea TaxID=104357 RepID=A0ABR3J4G6_9AGAR
MSAPRRSTRLNTIYDFSGLRLHSDGSRVEQSSSNLRFPPLRPSVRDARGNWVARDAAGPSSVKKNIFVEKDDGAEEDITKLGDIVETGRGASSEDEYEPKHKGKGKATDEVTQRNPRSRKRRKLTQDLEFLTNVTTSTAPSALPERALVPPLGPPSSDLLKCIHYFTSKYYTEHGVLYNATQQERQQQKQRRLERLAERQKGKRKAQARTSAHSDSDGHSEQSHDEGSSGLSSDEEEVQKPSRPKRAGTGKLARRKKKLHRDMYKSMDGSALVAIGMLMQEYVAGLLTPLVPDGWSEELARSQAFVESDDSEDPDLDPAVFSAGTPNPGNAGQEGDNDGESEEEESDNMSTEEGDARHSVQGGNSSRQEDGNEAETEEEESDNMSTEEGVTHHSAQGGNSSRLEDGNEGETEEEESDNASVEAVDTRHSVQGVKEDSVAVFEEEEEEEDD